MLHCISNFFKSITKAYRVSRLSEDYKYRVIPALDARRISLEEQRNREKYPYSRELMLEGLEYITPYIISSSLEGSNETKVWLNEFKYYEVADDIKLFLKGSGYDVTLTFENIQGEDIITYHIKW